MNCYDPECAKCNATRQDELIRTSRLVDALYISGAVEADVTTSEPVDIIPRSDAGEPTVISYGTPRLKSSLSHHNECGVYTGKECICDALALNDMIDSQETPKMKALERLAEINPELTHAIGTRMTADAVARATGPVTADGNNPLKRVMLDKPPVEPESVGEYIQWVDVRMGSLKRWVQSDSDASTRIALETIARIEGDLQQIRLLLKGVKRLTEGASDCPTCGSHRYLLPSGMPSCRTCEGR
jgi:hypothetical protein